MGVCWQLDETGAIVGGRKCTLDLHSPLRSIPDLHTIFRGGMAAFVNIHSVDLYSDPSLGGDELDDVGAKKIREQLIIDQVWVESNKNALSKNTLI